MSEAPHSGRSRSAALRLALVAVGIIMVAEAAIMALMPLVSPLTSAPSWVLALLDAGLLALISLPIMWRVILRPASQAAQHAQRAAQAIMDTAGEGIITTDEHGTVMTFNRAAERIFGIPAQEIVGQNVSKLMPPAYRDAHAGHMRAYLEEHGAKAIGRKRLMAGQRSNGETFPLEIAVSETCIVNRTVFISVVHDVSEYKATEAALSKANALLERILHGMHSPMAYLDRNFNFIRVNQAYAAADKQTPDFFAGKNHFALYPSPENEAIFRRVLETGEPYRVYAKPFEYAGHPERGVSYWDWSLEPEKDAQGQVQNLLLMLHDVTGRELAEQEKLRAIGRFRTLFEAAGDAIFIHDLQGRFLEVNQIACNRLGYTREELLQMTPRQIDTPEFAARSEERVADINAQGAIVFESAHVRRDGVIIPVEISSRLIDYDGRRAVLSTARDLSVRKRMDAALRESEANTRALLDSIRESALLLATNGTILSINRTGAHRLHQSVNAMRGKSLFDFLPPDLAESRRRRIDTVLATGLPLEFEDTHDGRLFDTSVYPVPDAKGNIHRIAMYTQDITEPRRLKAIEELLRAVDEQILQGIPLEQVVTFICDQMARLFDLRLAWIGEKRPDGSIALIAGAGPDTAYQEELPRMGVRWDEAPSGRGPTGTAIRLGRTQVVDIARAGPFAPWRETALSHGFAAICAIPLVIRGELFGAITLFSAHAEHFNDEPLMHALDNIAARVSVALESSFDHEQLRLLGTALATASNAVFITNRRGVIQWVNEAFIRLSGYTRNEIIGNTPRFLKSGAHDQAYYAQMWQIILDGEPFSSETTERRKDGSLYTVRQVITPVRGRDGEISHFISMHEDISEQLAAQKQIERMAHFDALTGLPNRSLFLDRLQQAISLCKRTSEHTALLFLDLDKFKPVNDTYGHAMGDALLKAVAERLQNCVRESDTVARIAGDEFTIILSRVGCRTDATAVAEKIVRAIGEPFAIDGQTLRIGISIGIALYPDDARHEQELVKRADDAMYQAKHRGRNTYCFHTPA
jgi:diguanylate cyclase (GGDEF)-like protein/PAS domain S-box-containing protein